MYLQDFDLKKPPFTQEFNLDMFFSGAGRKETLKGLRKDLTNGNSITRLTGPAGSGKTLLCHLLSRELAAVDYRVVYLDNPAGSFDELLYMTCLELGMEPSAESVQDMGAELHALLMRHKARGEKILLLIDEAEKIFLAALERLFRTFCTEEETHTLQVVLFGQPALNNHIERLGTYCSGVELTSNYVLKSFSEKETKDYLNFRLKAAGRREADETGRAEIFTSESVHKICNVAEGIPGSINILAEEALEVASADNASVVLPVHIVQHKQVDIDGMEDTAGKAGNTFRVLLLALLLAALLLFCQRNDLLYNRQKDISNLTDAALKQESGEFLQEDKTTGNGTSFTQSESPDVPLKNSDFFPSVGHLPTFFQKTEYTPPSADNGTKTLATAKKLPVIQPNWIIQLTPRMKKVRPKKKKKSTP